VDFSPEKIAECLRRMRIGGRLPDHQFDPRESLYLRMNQKSLQVDPDGVVTANFRVGGDDSVNRSKHGGEPQDVLVCEFPKFRDFGILAFWVDDLPKLHEREEHRGEKVDPIACRVVHDPVAPPKAPEENYYHCEIRFFRKTADGERVKNIPNGTKVWFREEMNRRLSAANVIRVPEV
jgi:hypothetical protein